MLWNGARPEQEPRYDASDNDERGQPYKNEERAALIFWRHKLQCKDEQSCTSVEACHEERWKHMRATHLGKYANCGDDNASNSGAHHEGPHE